MARTQVLVALLVCVALLSTHGAALRSLIVNEIDPSSQQTVTVNGVIANTLTATSATSSTVQQQQQP